MASVLARQRRDNAAKAKRASKSKRLNKKPTVKLIKRVLNSQLETKYVAEQLHGIDGGYPIPGSIDPTTNAHSCLPALALQGALATSNTREGDKIEPVRASVSGHIWYNNLDNNVGNIIYVKLFFMTIKDIKTFPKVLTDAPDGMFENGAPDPVKWVANSQELQSYYPICKQNYTLLKTMTFKLVKNGGLPIGNQPGHDTNVGKDRYTFSYSWKPPALKYATTTDTYPTNHAPVMYAVAYSPGYNYTTDASLVNQVNMSWQVSMSYKDA